MRTDLVFFSLEKYARFMFQHLSTALIDSFRNYDEHVKNVSLLFCTPDAVKGIDGIVAKGQELIDYAQLAYFTTRENPTDQAQSTGFVWIGLLRDEDTGDYIIQIILPTVEVSFHVDIKAEYRENDRKLFTANLCAVKSHERDGNVITEFVKDDDDDIADIVLHFMKILTDELKKICTNAYFGTLLNDVGDYTYDG